MRLSQHPGYQSYCQDRETYLRFKQALIDWEAGAEAVQVQVYGLNWNPTQAREFIAAISALFHEYNLVLWERFPYCRQCGGLCCLANVSHASLIDLLAIALLDRSLPVLADFIEAGKRDCIYHTSHGCGWPEGWRPLKCWSFYCLGSGDWELDGHSTGSYNDITEALQSVVRDLLPEILHRYEVAQGDPLADHLSDPLDFASAFRQAMTAVLLAPLATRYPSIAPGLSEGNFEQLAVQEKITPDRLIGENAVLAFVAEATDQLYELASRYSEGEKRAADLLLSDLEILEWIVANHPSDRRRLLAEMNRRYARKPTPDKESFDQIWSQMRAQILYLLRPAS